MVLLITFAAFTNRHVKTVIIKRCLPMTEGLVGLYVIHLCFLKFVERQTGLLRSCSVFFTGRPEETSPGEHQCQTLERPDEQVDAPDWTRRCVPCVFI